MAFDRTHTQDNSIPEDIFDTQTEISTETKTAETSKLAKKGKITSSEVGILEEGVILREELLRTEAAISNTKGILYALFNTFWQLSTHPFDVAHARKVTENTSPSSNENKFSQFKSQSHNLTN